MRCKECGKSFIGQAGLHKHIKAHKMSLQEYYHKHQPKYDLNSGDLIPFKNFSQYLDQDFIDVKNQEKWLMSVGQDAAADYLVKKFSEEKEKRTLKIGPASLFFKVSKSASLNSIRRIFGSYSNFCKIIGVKCVYCKTIPKDFWGLELGEMQILEDTREQLPLDFPNKIVSKLDFGDYTAAGQYYSQTFIERKSVSDFVGTFGSGYARFMAEMERAREFNSFLFVVVEGKYEDLESFAKQQKGKPNLDYVRHNVKNCLSDYSDVCQIVFAYNRSGAKKLIPKILKSGKEIWNVDLNYFVEEKIYGVEQG